MSVKVEEGRTYRFKCVGCRKFITWTAPHCWENSIPQFCQKKCKDRHSAFRNGERVFKCPKPYKKLFSEEAARAEALSQAKGRQLLYVAYKCTCGGWHVGHREVTLVV